MVFFRPASRARQLAGRGAGARLTAVGFRARGRYAVPIRDPYLHDSLEYVQP